MSRRRASGVVALAAGSIALAYLLPFRDYGLNLDDEGLVLSSIQRVAEGQVPYVDFVTGYTPGYFYLSAWLWRLAGDVPTLRVLLACVHAGAAAGLALVAARVASPFLAVLVALLYVAFIPVFPGEFCAFNIPYPAWFATLAWVAMVLALVGFVARRRRSALVAAGLGAAAALATKPNAGVFALAGAVATVLLVASPAVPAERSPGAGTAPLWWLFFGGIVAGPWVVFGGWPGTRDALVYLVPVTIALLALPTRARTHRRGLAGDLACVLAPFVAVSLPWLGYFWARLGTEAFLRDVLLLGSGASQLYYLSYPPFEPWALVVTLAAAGFALAGAGLRAGRVRPRHVMVAAALGLGVGIVALARFSVMPERTVWSLIWQLESAGFPLALATHAVGIVWLWRHRASPACELPAALLLCALFMHLQVYPRADFTHLVAAVPLTAVFAAFLLERVLGWWRAGAPGALGRAAVPVALGTLTAVLVLRVSPSIAARVSEPGPRLPFAVAPVRVERVHDAGLADLGAAATRLAALVPPGGASLTFPAVDVALFLSGARNPTPYHYFFPGRPDHHEEAEIVDALAAAPPAALVSANAELTFFDAAPPYYFLLRRFARSRYVLRERDGRYDVLARADLPGSPVLDGHVPDAARDLAAVAGRPLAEAAPVLLAHATADDATVRRTALATLADRLAAEPADGLEAWVARAGLDRRRQVLLLRTIRDTREARAASYLFASAASADARIANEALGAMYVTRAQLIARRNLWAGSEEPKVWPGREALLAAVRRVLADRGAAPRATAFAADLAGTLGDTATVPLLRSWLDGDAAIAASAADALARLAPAGLACDLVPLLGRVDLDLQAMIPTTLLRLAEASSDAVAGEARACIRRTVATEGPARETAIWIAAALTDPSFTPALRDALADPSAAVRRAAAWALGELPSEAATAEVLERITHADVDASVRRVATRAAAKQDGRAARAALAAGTTAGSAG